MTSNNWKSQCEISKKELRLILFIDPEKPARWLCKIQSGGRGKACERWLSGYWLQSSAALRFNIMPDYSDRADSTQQNQKAAVVLIMYSRYVKIALVLKLYLSICSRISESIVHS